MGIRGLLGFLVPGFMALGLLTGGLVAARIARGDAVAEFEARHADAMRVVATSVASALADNDAAGLDDLVEQNARGVQDPSLVELAIIDPYGRIVAHSAPTRFGEVVEDGFALRAVAATTETTRMDGHQLRIAVPAVAGLRWGTVLATYDLTGVQAEVDGTWRTIIAVAVGLALVAWGVLAWGLNQLVVTPIRALERAADAMRAGELDVRVAPSGAQELAALANIFNAMASALREQRAELEQRVEERTAALRDANAKLERLALEDGLTGLLNHRRFRELLLDEFTRAKRTNRPFALLMIDADHFKRYNDTLGHPAGDAMLRRLAGVIRATVRASDRVARYGGEEFAVLLPETEGAVADAIAERVRAAIAESCAGNTNEPPVTASIGVAAWPHDADDAVGLLDCADRGLYRAKERGRNCVVGHRSAT